MTRQPQYSRLAAARRAGRRGFSFVEVMFAVIILGIGFIMVSAMFPVAIQQTQMNVEDAAVSRALLAAQTNFTQLKQDLTTQIRNSTINNPNYPNGLITSLYYSWPVTGNPNQPGKVYSFRDARPVTYPVYTPPSTVLIPPSATQYQLPLASNYSAVPPALDIGIWEQVRGNMVSSAESQFAYVPMFQRAAGASQVNIYCFLATARNRTPYTYTANAGVHSDVFRFTGETNSDTNADTIPPASPPATLEPRLVSATFHSHLNFPSDPNADPIVDLVELTATNYEVTDSPDAAGPGGFVIVSDDNPTNAAAAPNAVPPFNPGQLNGSAVFRLGAQRASLPNATPPSTAHNYIYELQPGYDISSAQALLIQAAQTASTSGSIDVFILGRGYSNPDMQHTTTSNPYDGPVQDIAVQQLPPIPVQ